MGKSVYITKASSSHLLFTAHPELVSPWSLLDLGQPSSPCPQQMGYFWPGFGCWGLPSLGAVEAISLVSVIQQDH